MLRHIDGRRSEPAPARSVGRFSDLASHFSVVRDGLRYRPLQALLGCALVLRLTTMWLYAPAVLEGYDTTRFTRANGPSGLFDDYWMPAGYALFLKLAHRISDHVWFAILLQHAIGMALILVVFLAVERSGAGRVAATVAAAIVALSGDLLYLEHTLLADQFLFTFAALACTLLIAGLTTEDGRRWLIAAGVCAMCAMLSRSVGLAVVASTLTVAAWLAPDWRARRAQVASVAGGAAAVFAVYLVAFFAAGGNYLGLTDMRGWNLYSRIAPFADCSEFTPPKGSELLCERTAPSERRGPFSYVWDPSSTGRRALEPLGPATGRLPGEFARTAILHQPLAYAEAVGTDLLRYIEPGIGRQNGLNGGTRDDISFGHRNPVVEAQIREALQPRYKGTDLHIKGGDALADYQQVFRIDRLLLLLSLVIVAIGLIRLRGPARAGVAAFGLSALGLFVLPTLTVSYDYRYGVPPTNLLAIAAVTGAVSLRQVRSRPV